MTDHEREWFRMLFQRMAQGECPAPGDPLVGHRLQVVLRHGSRLTPWSKRQTVGTSTLPTQMVLDLTQLCRTYGFRYVVEDGQVTLVRAA